MLPHNNVPTDVGAESLVGKEQRLIYGVHQHVKNLKINTFWASIKNAQFF